MAKPNLASTDPAEPLKANPDLPGVAARPVTKRLAAENENVKQDLVAVEVPVAFAYNNQSHAVMMASPVNLHDFAIGFSLTERIVDAIDDILDIDIRHAKQGITIQLQVKPHLLERLQRQRRQMSGRSGCGICGITDLAAAMPKLAPLVKTAVPDHATVERAVELFKQSQVLQQDCGAVHAAALFNRSGELVAIREDVGRHNALDKLIGAQWGKLDVNQFVLMSSRTSHELITKMAIAGIGTLVSISAATTLAIDAAEEINLNLIGFIRGARQLVYTKLA